MDKESAMRFENLQWVTERNQDEY